MSKKRPSEVGATRGGPHHASRLHPEQCMLCRQVVHRASECPNKGKPTAFSPGKRAFGTYAQGCAVFDSQCYGATVEEIEQDQDEEDIEDFVAFSIKSLEGFVTLDGEVTKTVSGFMSVQPVADRYEDITIETTDVSFTFAGGETEAANTKICIPHVDFPQGISVNVVSNESTPFLVGLDLLREYGLVIDYHYSRVYNHLLKRYLPCAILPTGHLALEMLPSNSEQGQHPVPSHALSTGHWGLHSGAQEKGTPSFKSSIFHLRDEKSEHEHGHTCTSEDDLLILLNLPERTQTWTRFDKRAKTYRTTSSSGPLWENVVARITIDDETGHIMSLEYTKHVTEKDLHRNLPSDRDIRTVLLHFSPVTPNQQLKQSFQTFAALPVDETTQQTSQIQTAVRDELSVGSDRPGAIAKDLFQSFILSAVSHDDAVSILG